MTKSGTTKDELFMIMLYKIANPPEINLPK